MRLFGTAALVAVVALAASQCAAQTAERAPIQFSRAAEQQKESLHERKLSKDKKKKKHHHQKETETEGTPIPEEYYKETRQQQPSCSICGDGMKVGDPNAAVSFPGQAGQIPCGVLENMGAVGLIPPAQCAVLPQLISTVCECESINPPTTTGATEPATTTEATKKPGHSGKGSKSAPILSHSMSLPVPSKAGKSIHGKATSPTTGKSSKNTVISTKSYKSLSLSLPSSSKGHTMSKASAKSAKSASKSSKSSGTVDAKAEKVSSAKAAKAVTPKAAKSSSRA